MARDSRLTAAVGAVAMLALASVSVAGLTFNITSTGNAQADAGFAAAGERWSSLLSASGNVVVNITAGFESFSDPGIIGAASSNQGYYDYSQVRATLRARGTTADDSAAAAFLPNSTYYANSIKMLINTTADNPAGAGSTVRYLDDDGSANNQTIRMTSANAKALGLKPGAVSDADAQISFSSDFAFDFDPSDGIGAGQIDFIGVATHEIGHALGFVSGVDILDINGPLASPDGPFESSLFTFVSPLDLFRYSSASTAMHAIDWTADTRSKYFSLNGGVTSLAEFSTGMFYGDGSQASHWKDGLGIGLMDPTTSYGELMSISPMDIRMMDVVGWTPLASLPEPLLTGASLPMSSPVPEPTGAAVVLVSGVMLTMQRRRAAGR